MNRGIEGLRRKYYVDGIIPLTESIRWATLFTKLTVQHRDRKSTRLNSSHVKISYAVFCLKKKTDNKRLQNLGAAAHQRIAGGGAAARRHMLHLPADRHQAPVGDPRGHLQHAGRQGGARSG